MDFNELIGALSLTVSTLQLKLDHFRKGSSGERVSHRDMMLLGEAIRSLEYALRETIAASSEQNLRANRRLSKSWEDATDSLRRVPGCEEIASIAFDKSVFWRNPKFADRLLNDRRSQISLDNVLKISRKLSTDYQKAMSRAA